jgi:4-hydroxybutyrate CoA-transferase
MQSVSAEVAVSNVKSGDRVFLHGMSAMPQVLSRALRAREGDIHDVEICHLHTEGPSAFLDSSSFFLNNLFVGSNVREAVQRGLADYVPVFLSEVPNMFRRGVLPIDVAMVQVSPPDKHGFVTLGVSVDAALAAVESARVVLAEINPNMPRTHGDGSIHLSRFAAVTEVDYALPTHDPSPPGEVEMAIGRRVAELVEDGATLQMGIGGIPNAVLAALGGHKNLGIHTEMFSDGVLPLVESGVINNELKTIHRGKLVAGFVNGSANLYRFVDDNPMVMLRDISFVNDTAVIRKLPRMTAINSAIEIDLTGQICADSIGTKTYSGVGGQMDFVRGASLSEGGKPIFALPSRTSRGRARITACLQTGAGVVTTRAHVQFVATEYGLADLYGKNLRQRARALIDIAHPDDRESLERDWSERSGVVL